MKILNIVAFLLVLLFALPEFAQETSSPTPQSEIEMLRRQLAEQKAQIEKIERLLDKLVKADETGKSNSISVAATGTAATVTPVDSTVAVASPTPAPKPEHIDVGFGKVKFSGLVQTWFSHSDQGVSDTFRVRRAELYLNGEISPKIKWTIMIDPSKALALNTTSATVAGTPVVTSASVNQAGRILQDANVTYTPIRNLNLKFGQFKLPLGYEGGMSSALLETVERTQFLADRNRGGNLGDVRDLGVMAFGTIDQKFDYYVGVFNGSGENQNDVDRNDQKALAGRFLYHLAAIKGLHFGVSGVWGNGQRTDRPRRDRLGAELYLLRPNYSFRAEVMTGKDVNQHRLGYYSLVTRKFTPKLEGVFRFDYFDPDRRLENNSLNVVERNFHAGFNYYIDENHFKFQINYVRKNFASNFQPSRNLILANLQTTW